MCLFKYFTTHQKNKLRTEKRRFFFRAKVFAQQQGIIEQVIQLRSGTGLGTQRFVVNDHARTVLLGHIFRIIFLSKERSLPVLASTTKKHLSGFRLGKENESCFCECSKSERFSTPPPPHQK
ncbi:hypothetical protein TNCT_121 [Trichonephila clavata]|uniref:Uncharacterized protein n=1 Tax=Trichonephila clavata TaxID=2740835 RepID=A0A8X6KEF0_TRICU|nr:hypothetical protein TNCT_121 [Trichonephila clavata]